jgi:hypothetical protein
MNRDAGSLTRGDGEVQRQVEAVSRAAGEIFPYFVYAGLISRTALEIHRGQVYSNQSQARDNVLDGG